MSKRFGRNQKRHMREALAEQEKKRHFAEKTAVEHWNSWHRAVKEGEELRKFFDEVGRRVGQHAFIACGMSEIDMSEDPAQGRRFAIVEEFFSPSSKLMPSNAQMRFETMRRLDVKAVCDHFRGEVVCRAYINGKEAGIAVSETLLRQLNKEQLFTLIHNNLAKQLAYHLSTALKGE